MEHEGMEVDGGTFIGSLSKVGEHLLAFSDKDVVGVLAESADVEDVRGHFALPLPVRSISSEYTFFVGIRERRKREGRGIRLVRITVVSHTTESLSKKNKING